VPAASRYGLIRRDCALFLPIISVTTQQRDEGYFRREWRQAVDRTHDMAGRATFLIPVVIDDTNERGRAHGRDERIGVAAFGKRWTSPIS
jgi:hypothetical protein